MYVFFCLFACLPACLSVCLFLSFFLSVFLSVSLSANLSFCRSVCLFLSQSLSVFLSVFLSLCLFLSACPSFCLSVFQSVCLVWSCSVLSSRFHCCCIHVPCLIFMKNEAINRQCCLVLVYSSDNAKHLPILLIHEVFHCNILNRISYDRGRSYSVRSCTMHRSKRHMRYT